MTAKNKPLWSFVIKALIVLLLFILFFNLNVRTCLLWDDLDYSFVCTSGEPGASAQIPLTSIGDVFRSQAVFRETWGGRNVVHWIAQFFLMLGDKRIFDVCNSIVYMILLWGIWANSGFQKGRGFVFVPLAFYMLWYFPRHFNQSTLWLVGSCNYLWGITLVVLALIPVRRYWQSFESGSLPGRSLPAPLAILYCIFCFFAGWTNENTGFALPMMMAMFMAALWLTKRRIPRWMPVATLAALAGWIVLFTAPGNWVRMGITESGSSRLESLIQSLVSVTTILFKRYIPLGILCLAACLLYYWQHQRGWDRESWIAYIPTFIFAVGGVASAYAAVISPSFSARAWYGIVILLIITVGNSFALVTPDRRVYTLLLCTAILWAPKYAIDYKNGLEDVNASAAYWQWVGEEIEEAKANDVYEIVLPVHTPITSYSHAEYSSGDPDAWPNTTLAIHYGMDKISFSRDLDDPFQLTYDFT